MGFWKAANYGTVIRDSKQEQLGVLLIRSKCHFWGMGDDNIKYCMLNRAVRFERIITTHIIQ